MTAEDAIKTMMTIAAIVTYLLFIFFHPLCLVGLSNPVYKHCSTRNI
jgi:hypothetical protein